MDIHERKWFKNMYNMVLPRLLEQYPKWDPYTIVSHVTFTPIEENVWINIRSIGIPMLPQFPVGPFFIDFADPIRKIGIEVDGKEFHKDKEKDQSRQKWLENQGWSIFRIEGAATFRGNEDFDDEEDHSHLPFLKFEMGDHLYNCSSEKAIQLIKEYYYEDTDLDP